MGGLYSKKYPVMTPGDMQYDENGEDCYRWVCRSKRGLIAIIIIYLALFVLFSHNWNKVSVGTHCVYVGMVAMMLLVVYINFNVLRKGRSKRAMARSWQPKRRQLKSFTRQYPIAHVKNLSITVGVWANCIACDIADAEYHGDAKHRHLDRNIYVLDQIVSTFKLDPIQWDQLINEKRSMRRSEHTVKV